MAAEGDRRQNWQFYQHLWLALLTAPDIEANHMDIGGNDRTTPLAFARLAVYCVEQCLDEACTLLSRPRR